ncbi:amidohydrolase [Aestuariivirga sp.]|uniref:amidohydrolase n=1 Tax=Aestuariivirga sp. TaxID=2650926 RepID=UPI0039E2BC7C
MTADLIIINGKFLTQDEANPKAEAMAIRGNAILSVGTVAEAKALAGPETQVIDAQGKTVLPGFVESHMHLFGGASELDHMQFFGVHGLENMQKVAKAYLATHPGDDIVFGQQCDYIIIGEHEPLTRHHLDTLSKDRPLLVFSPDHHTAWANTIALERAGILKGRKLGPGNEIVMAADGLASGELREGQAIDPVRELSRVGDRSHLGIVTGGEPDPYPTAEEFEHDLGVIKQGLAHCARHGITSIHNMDGNIYQLELLEELELRGELTARVRVPFHFKNFMKIADLEKASAMAQRWRSEMLSAGFVKVFVDGVIDSATGVMVEPYSDNPSWRGEPLFTAEHFAEVAVEADRRGLQIAVHAIGDGAVRIVLDGYEKALKANGKRDSRHRVEHIEVIHPDDIPRFREMGVIASMQPPHPPGNHGLPLEPYLSRIGENRWQYAFAWNTLRDAGARIAFATDWPVSDIDPLWSIQSAMTRPMWKPGLPDQRQTLTQSLRSYTHDGAYTEFMEHRKGMLKPGLLADVVILDADIEKTDPAKLKSVKPAATICDGRVVYRAHS